MDHDVDVVDDGERVARVGQIGLDVGDGVGLVHVVDGAPEVGAAHVVSGGAQSQDDRESAIDMATTLGAETGAQLYAYSILPANDTNYTRTTLPHCVAACDGGHGHRLRPDGHRDAGRRHRLCCSGRGRC